jgi:regulator of RNase E activity RraA
MSAWSDDEDLFAVARSELFPAVVGDILDTMGLRRQFLPREIGPMVPDTILIGRAMPVLDVDFPMDEAGAGHGGLAGKPFGRMFEALDDLKPNEIYVASGCSCAFALWGGLMSTRAKHLRAAGAVLDGCHRDSVEIQRLGFPVFSRGAYAQDQGVRGKVVDFRVPLQIGQAIVSPGDILFGDRDGVLVVPRAAEAEAFRRAIEKVRTESKVRDAIAQGMSTVEAFERFGVM